MFHLGQYQSLTIHREAPPGLYLTNDQEEEILLPNKYIPGEAGIGDTLTVFVYLDHQERPVATTLSPFVTVNDLARLRCVETTDIGAFLDWGLEKQLFVPFKEQRQPFKKGHWYLIYCYLDQKSGRLAASGKVNQFLDNEALTVEPFEKVDLIISEKTDMGFHVIINKLHQGLVYHDEIFQEIRTGDKLQGWVKKIREDHKIDVVLQRPGYRSIEPNAEKVLRKLEADDGFLGLHDKSKPEEIEAALQMSKKSFKRAIGKLYKRREIRIVPRKGIYRR